MSAGKSDDSFDFRNREILDRLYWVDAKSVANIAKIFGTSKGHIHYYLTKFGIPRREWSAKRPKCNPNELHELYWKKGMTIRKVAKLVGISYSTTRKHLLRQGQLRARYRAIRYQRTPFSGDNRELAYLEGLRGGDLNAARTSPNSVMARVSTTHPAMLELFQQTFDAHGHCNVVPRRVFLTGYDWQVRVYLDNTFGFLIKKPNSIPEGRENFFAFLAGLADSDGSWIVSRDKGKSKYALVIKSEELDLLRTVRIRLESLGFHPALHLDKEKGISKILNGIAGKRRITLTMDLWRLELYRWREVISLADEILPISRHWEKIEKMKIMLKAKKTEWTVVEPLISNLRKKIRNQVNDSIKRAGIEYKARHEGCYQSGVVC